MSRIKRVNLENLERILTSHRARPLVRLNSSLFKQFDDIMILLPSADIEFKRLYFFLEVRELVLKLLDEVYVFAIDRNELRKNSWI